MVEENAPGIPYIASGGIIIFLGLLAIIFPYITGISLSLLLGILLFVGAIVHTAQAFSSPGWKSAAIQVALAILYGIAGISLIVNPVIGLTTLTVILAAYLTANGIIEILYGIRIRKNQNWFWFLISGLISLLLAALIWIGWPSSALWAIGLLFGANLIVTGASLVILGLNPPD